MYSDGRTIRVATEEEYERAAPVPETAGRLVPGQRIELVFETDVPRYFTANVFYFSGFAQEDGSLRVYRDGARPDLTLPISVRGVRGVRIVAAETRITPEYVDGLGLFPASPVIAKEFGRRQEIGRYRGRAGDSVDVEYADRSRRKGGRIGTHRLDDLEIFRRHEPPLPEAGHPAADTIVDAGYEME